MDGKHRLNAPNNESLQDIEQLGDHSELSALYFNAHVEWEGKDIISDEERHARRAKEQLKVTLSIRKWFAVIGLLVPLTFVLFVVLLAVAVTYITVDNARFALPLVIIFTGIWLIASYLSLRQVYTLFYAHALKATPFVVILIVLCGLSTQASYLLTRPIQPGTFLGNTLIVGAATMFASVVLSGLLLLIWTSPRLKGNNKMAIIAIIASAILLLILVTTLL